MSSNIFCLASVDLPTIRRPDQGGPNCSGLCINSGEPCQHRITNTTFCLGTNECAYRRIPLTAAQAGNADLAKIEELELQAIQGHLKQESLTKGRSLSSQPKGLFSDNQHLTISNRDITPSERDLYVLALETWGPSQQEGMLLEEMGEAIVALNKIHRARDREDYPIDEFLGELADVSIMIDQMRVYFDRKRTFEAVRRFKIIRLAERLGLDHFQLAVHRESSQPESPEITESATERPMLCEAAPGGQLIE